jgi:trimethylamine--corrinoid protein Co-methyltransferase
VDAQAGMESGISIMIGALAGINMISGAGMLDFMTCASPEKLVIDAEGIGMAKRMLQGIKTPTATLATEFYEKINATNNFINQENSKFLFESEHFQPSKVIDRGSVQTWMQNGGSDIFKRADSRVREILETYQTPEMEREQLHVLGQILFSLTRNSVLPAIPPQ